MMEDDLEYRIEELENEVSSIKSNMVTWAVVLIGMMVFIIVLCLIVK